MRKKAWFLAGFLALTGCYDNGSKTDDPNVNEPTENCPERPTCENDRVVTCKDGAFHDEACPQFQTCLDGQCVPDGKCNSSDFDAYCNNNTAVYCRDGVITREDCSRSCLNGKCAEAQCDDSFKSYCDEAGKRTICKDGEIVSEACEEGVCSGGSCIVPPPDCGNGQLDDGEACDDGAINGSYNKCRADCSGLEECGDGSLTPGVERCDDGEDNGKYGKCRTDCKSIAECGDGIFDDPDEACDDGSDNGKYGKCRADCSGIAKCGDGIVDEAHEICDDGADNGKEGKCRADCSGIPGCGNGLVEAPEECDPPSADMIVQCTEQCRKMNVLYPEYPTAENVTMEIKSKCDQADLWQKYLIYRERFLGNAEKHIPGFVSFGTKPGESIPAAYRNPSLKCATDWTFHHTNRDCEFEELSDAEGAYSWGDASLWLGIMVHWLALEYRTFKLLGLDTSETVKDIAMALKAFDRIDEAAETYFGLDPALDGFFIRDDIPRDFFKNGENYRFERNDGGFIGYECAASTNTCAIHSGVAAEQMIKDGVFVSQDQITGIYEGFGMVAKFVDDDAEFEGMKIRHSARSAIDRIIRYLKRNSWRIGIQVGNKWLSVPEEWGGYTQLLSCFFAEGANAVCAPDFGLENYHDDATNAFKTTISKAIGLLWPMWETKNNYNRNLILRVMNYTTFWDDEFFNTTSLESGREFWALSHALYHEHVLTDDYPLWHMHSILASAPCDGPCMGDNCKNPTPGWMGEHFFVSPNYRIGYGHGEGDYNGLDYLIAHNLYLLAYAQKTGRAYSHQIPTFVTSKHQLQDMIDLKLSSSVYEIDKNPAEMNMLFCGRPLLDWIRDNALGMVDIYVKDMRWSCTMDGKCDIVKDDKPYTHKNALIIGTNGNDKLTVPKGYHHCIAALDGDDEITAAEGMHIVEGGNGNDTIRTGGPHVFVYGGDGDDTIYPGNGYHLVDAGPGNDLVESSSSGTHLIFGGDGNDTIRAAGGGNWIVGGYGNDTLEANAGDNVVWGNDGDDRIYLGDGDNIIYPGPGNAFILVGNGDNSIQTVQPQNDDVKICFGTGKNSIYAGWSTKSHCSAAQNSDIHQNSCVPDLTAEDCSLEAYHDWRK